MGEVVQVQISACSGKHKGHTWVRNITQELQAKNRKNLMLDG
jgi:ribosomal protein S28E/S33